MKIKDILSMNLTGKALYIPYEQLQAYREVWQTMSDFSMSVKNGFPHYFCNPNKEFATLEQVQADLQAEPYKICKEDDRFDLPTALVDGLNPTVDEDNCGDYYSNHYYYVNWNREVFNELHLEVGTRLMYTEPLVRRVKRPKVFAPVQPSMPAYVEPITDLFGNLANEKEVELHKVEMTHYEKKLQDYKNKLHKYEEAMGKYKTKHDWAMKYLCFQKVYNDEVFGDYQISRDAVRQSIRRYLPLHMVKWHETPIHLIVPKATNFTYGDGKIFINNKLVSLRSEEIYFTRI